MKNITKKIMVALLATAMCATASVSTAFASDVTAGENSLENEYISVKFDSDGTHYFMFTTGGDPDNANDDDKRLLYSSWGTSSMFVNIDGSTSEVRSDDEIVVDAENKQLVTTYYTYNGIEFKKVLTIVPNDTTGREDTVEFKLVATNVSEESHTLGARIMIDTMLGENDRAPFRIPSIGAVTTKTELTGNDIPAMYQAFDSLDNPTVVSTGSFAKGAGKPDLVQFNNWSISNSPSTFIPECDAEESIGDSAVNAIWNEKELAAGESVVYKMYYGLGQVVVNTESELVLGATKVDTDFTVNEEGTGYNPVSIMGYIKNAGDVSLNNVEMSIELPIGVSLVDGEGNVNFGTVEVNGENQTTFTLNADPVGSERVITVTIKAKSDETGEVVPITYTYTLPAIEGAPEPPTEAPTEEPTEEPTEAPTEEVTDAPTEVPTSATNPTSATSATSATNATSATSATTATTATTAQTGKVATGDARSIVPMLGLLLTSAGALVTLRKRAKNK